MPATDKKLEQHLEALKSFLESNKELEKYLEKSTSWSDSRIELLEKSETKAWRVTYASSGFTFLTLIALICLLPLKTVKTEILKVDKLTGKVEPLETLKESQITMDEAVTKKFIYDFMLARENYTFDTAELNYYTAAAFMSPQLQRQWEAYWDTNNPENPFKVYKNSTKVVITINSMTIHSKNDGKKDVATIRFSKSIEQGEAKSVTQWVATVTFKYINVPTEEKLRRINPLGFQIIDYRVDQEIETSLHAPASHS